ncbi:MAG: ATP-binding protein [Rhodospirillales bacterium]
MAIETRLSGIRPFRALLSQSARLRATGIVLALLTLLAAAAQSWFIHRVAFREERDDLMNLTILLAEYIERTTETLGQLLVATGHGVLHSVRHEAGATHEMLMHDVRSIAYIRDVHVLDHHGTMLASSAAAGAAALRESNERHLATHRSGPRQTVYVDRPIKSPHDGLWAIRVSRRLEDADGSFTGVVIATLDDQHFGDFFASIDHDPDTAVSLLGPDGTLLLRHPHAEGWVGRVLVPTLPDLDVHWRTGTRGARAVRTVTARSPIDGKERLVAMRRVEGEPFMVAVAETTTAAIAPVANAVLVIMGAGGAGASALLIYFAALARRAARNEALTRALAQSKAQAEQDREAAVSEEQRKSLFWSSLGHELRSPLNAVIGFSDLLRSNAFGKPSRQQAEYASHINEAGQHLLAIVNDLMDVAAMEAGRLRMSESEVDLAAVARGAAAMVGPQAEAAGVALGFDDGGIAPTLRGDETRLRQVLINLLSNAVKYSDAGGTVSLTLAAAGDGGIAVRVADTGIGMTADEVENALQPFGRADNEKARRRSGTGLGLSISKGLVERHDGTLAIRSEPGRGTTVTLTFPPDRVLPPETAQAAE